MHEMANQAQDNCQEDTEQDHGRYGKIEAEVVPFDADIARQAADPVKLIPQEIPDYAGEDQEQADADKQFSDRCLLPVHESYDFGPRVSGQDVERGNPEAQPQSQRSLIPSTIH